VALFLRAVSVLGVTDRFSVAWAEARQIRDEQILSVILAFIALTLLTACDRGRERTNVITGHGEPEVTVMDFPVLAARLGPFQIRGTF
jgi:hypothetical protein